MMQVTWKDALNNNNAWDTLTWFAALIGMASYLNKYGFIKWFSNQVSPSFSRCYNECLQKAPANFRCAISKIWMVRNSLSSPAVRIGSEFL